MEEQAKQDMEKLFPREESYDRAIDLIRKVKRLVPITSKSGIEYLETIIDYVDALINGDDIHSYLTFKHISKYAKEAFEEIMTEVQGRILEEDKKERAALKEEVCTLSNKQQALTSSVEGLENRKRILQLQAGQLSVEVETTRKELDDLRQNGIARANEEVSSVREKLNEEITTLTETKENLNTSIQELKKILSDYNRTISKLNEQDNAVEWKPLEKDDPIYYANHMTIRNYIESMKIKYMDEMRVNREVCDREFDKNMPGLKEFIELVETFNNVEVVGTASIRAAIKNVLWTDSAQRKVNMLVGMLKTFKVPHYQSKQTDITTQGLSADTLPTNVNTMLRELYLQRMVVEAVTKQRLAEAQLESVVAVLKAVAPENLDLRSVVSTSSELDYMLPGTSEMEVFSPSDSAVKVKR